jgi:hypothetical protein
MVMNKRNHPLISFILFAALSTFVVAGVVAGWQQLRALNPNVSAAIVAALAAVGGAIYNQRQTRSREIFESHRAQKIEVYSLYMDITDHVMKPHQEGLSGDPAPEALEELYRKFRRGILVWGSPDVIKVFLSFRVTQGRQILQRADDMFREIRKDLGNSNLGLEQGDLIKLFLKDPAEYELMMTDESSAASGLPPPKA